MGKHQSDRIQVIGGKLLIWQLAPWVIWDIWHDLLKLPNSDRCINIQPTAPPRDILVLSMRKRWGCGDGLGVVLINAEKKGNLTERPHVSPHTHRPPLACNATET